MGATGEIFNSESTTRTPFSYERNGTRGNIQETPSFITLSKLHDNK
jgi:hypothetical protein